MFPQSGHEHARIGLVVGHFVRRRDHSPSVARSAYPLIVFGVSQLGIVLISKASAGRTLEVLDGLYSLLIFAVMSGHYLKNLSVFDECSRL